MSVRDSVELHADIVGAVPDGAGRDHPWLSEQHSVAWFHHEEAASPSYVLPSIERASVPAKIDFTFINRSKSETSCGHWYFYKLVGDDWYHIGPYYHTTDCRVLPPGGAKRWTLHAYYGEALPCEESAAYGFLGGGEYAAVAGYAGVNLTDRPFRNRHIHGRWGRLMGGSRRQIRAELIRRRTQHLRVGIPAAAG